MNIYKKISLFFLIPLILGVQACVSDTSEHTRVVLAEKHFFGRLQQAVLTADSSWVAAHVSYPITIDVNQNRTSIESKEDFEKYYKSIINQKVYEAIKLQTKDDLFRNWSGVRIGSGEIWFEEVITEDKGEILIIAINN